mgnify:FL=1|tara:strand:- start:94 stop:495 length:402 start_codon:yes stop_codon:yes gene_type:complete
MSEGFKLEIVNPEKSFLLKDNVLEVIVPAFEGDMGILKNHISIISFLKPGLVKIITSGSSDETYYVEDGIIEFKNNCLSILTSNIFDTKKVDKSFLKTELIEAEKHTLDPEISDQKKYLIDQKIDVLKSLTLN